MLLLNIEKCPLEAVAIEQLNQLPNLYSLTLTSCGIGDEALKRLQTPVKHLTLQGDDFTDDCFPALSKQPRLVSLTLANASVTGKGLSVLKDSPALELLYISDVPLTNDDVPFLADLTNLKRLYVDRSKITATAFEELSRQINAKIVHSWLPGEDTRGGYPAGSGS
jgi:Leucine-rich repeat (LRR) protein